MDYFPRGGVSSVLVRQSDQSSFTPVNRGAGAIRSRAAFIAMDGIYAMQEQLHVLATEKIFSFFRASL